MMGAAERKEVGDWHSQPSSDFFERLERWCIPAAFHQAQEINRDIERLGELLLSHSAFNANLP
jgi:hypothetical protein